MWIRSHSIKVCFAISFFTYFPAYVDQGEFFYITASEGKIWDSNNYEEHILTQASRVLGNFTLLRSIWYFLNNSDCKPTQYKTHVHCELEHALFTWMTCLIPLLTSVQGKKNTKQPFSSPDQAWLNLLFFILAVFNTKVIWPTVFKRQMLSRSLM